MTETTDLAEADPPGLDVVYVVWRYPERSQTFVSNEVARVRAHGHRVRVAALEPTLDRADDVADDPAVVVTEHPQGRRPLARRLTGLMAGSPAGVLRALRLLGPRPDRENRLALQYAATLLEELGDDLPVRWHAHFADLPASVAMYAAALSERPFSFTSHAIDVFVKEHDLRRKLERADVAVTVCDYNRRWLESRHPGVGHHVVVPCGVDTRRFDVQDAPPPDDPLRVVSVGRLVAKKGYDHLVAAIALLEDRGIPVSCRILGEGPARAELEDAIAAARLHSVSLEGAASPADVRAALHAAHVFVLPCVVAADGDRDSQPVVVKEAMATGLPVVASSEVGLPEMVVDGRTGRLVPPHDPQAIADALALLAEDPASRARLGAAGRRRVVDHFDLDVTIPRLLAAWGGRAER